MMSYFGRATNENVLHFNNNLNILIVLERGALFAFFGGMTVQQSVQSSARVLHHQKFSSGNIFEFQLRCSASRHQLHRRCSLERVHVSILFDTRRPQRHLRHQRDAHLGVLGRHLPQWPQPSPRRLVDSLGLTVVARTNKRQIILKCVTALCFVFTFRSPRTLPHNVFLFLPMFLASSTFYLHFLPPT
jgi:hypothetical protein